MTSNAAANVELIRSSLAAFNANDLDACWNQLTDGFVIHLAELPEPLHGRDVWRQGAEMMKQAFPDLAAHIDDVVADGDRVALRLTFTGTHRGDFLGYPATGRTVRYVSHEFYRVDDGLFAEEWICSDLATLMRQIG
jgi:steroid delta-isomerase-like uncharacterized protein